MEKLRIESFGVLGITVRTTNENEQSSQDIPALWGRFMSEGILQQIPNKVDESIYCVYIDYEKDYTRPYTTLLGCKVSNVTHIPAGMTFKEISTGEYVRYVSKGNIMQGIIYNTWKEIWRSARNRQYTADFEVYGKKAENRENAEVEIFVAVK